MLRREKQAARSAELDPETPPYLSAHLYRIDGLRMIETALGSRVLLIRADVQLIVLVLLRGDLSRALVLLILVDAQSTVLALPLGCLSRDLVRRKSRIRLRVKGLESRNAIREKERPLRLSLLPGPTDATKALASHAPGGLPMVSRAATIWRPKLRRN